MREATAAFVRERLETCFVRDDDYRRTLNLLSHSLAQLQLDALAFWLELNDEWPDAEWTLPDFAKDALRQQSELHFHGEHGPIPLFRGFMTPEKLKSLYDFLCTAQKIETRFMEEHDGEAPSEFVRTIAISMFIEENRGQKPVANGRMAVPPCPACSGPMHDNRDNKKNPKGPDFRCKDENCEDDKGFRTATWVRDYDQNGKLKPKKKAEVE